MNPENPTNDLLTADQPEAPKMSGGLNVLTILTFIGSALQFFGGIWNFFNAEKSYKEMDKVIGQMNSESMPAWAKSMMGDAEHYRQLITKSYENRLPILLITVAAALLCFYGALQMRKLKKQGYPIYTIGELLPFVSQALFIGFFSFSGMIFYIALAITLLFILMYTLQRKNLVY